MKSIEERAKEHSLNDFDGYYTGREKAFEDGYIMGVKRQRKKDMDKFEKWYCKNKCYRRKECLIPLICARLGKIEKEVFGYEND